MRTSHDPHLAESKVETFWPCVREREGERQSTPFGAVLSAALTAPAAAASTATVSDIAAAAAPSPCAALIVFN